MGDSPMAGSSPAITVPVDGTLSTPRSVTVADVNGDGNPDLLVATGTSVAVLLGDGTGEFSAAGNAPATAGTLADVNGDGVLDAIVTTAGTNTVAVLLGTGNGGFGPATDYAVGADPQAVTVADVNGDGRPDIIVANTFTGTLSLLLGTGGGGFAPATSIPLPGVSPSPVSVTAADVNGDGNPDLLVATGTGVQVLLGDGNGGFAPAVNYPTGFGTDDVTTADVNGDGRLDLIVSFSGDDFAISGGDPRGRRGPAGQRRRRGSTPPSPTRPGRTRVR